MPSDGQRKSRMRDIIIIGAGVSGTACARELSRYKLDILVVESREDVCCGTSKANSAIVHAGFDAKTDSLMAKLNVIGNAMMDKLCKELDIKFQRNGSLVACYSENDIEKLEELKKKEKKYFIPDQFTNVNNPKAHYETTAEEILKDLDNKVDVFICGTGTGGSFSGTAKKLKERLPNIKTFPVEPASSPLLSKGYIGPHKIQGMGMSIGGIPAVYDGSLADGILTCEDDDAFKMMRELSFKEGILAGISTGATLKAALDYSKENANKNLKIVILSTDSGEKYLSNICEL